MNSQNYVTMGYGFKFDQSETVLLRGQSANDEGSQNFEISYNPDEGWKSQCDEVLMRVEREKADVFGFSKKNMVSQFKEAFKDKKECKFRFNRPLMNTGLIKFQAITVEWLNATSTDISVFAKSNLHVSPWYSLS